MESALSPSNRWPTVGRASVPIVFDADELSDIPLRLARGLGHGAPLPLELAAHGLCFIATSVADETPGTLRQRAKTDTEYGAAVEIWFELVLPALTVVEMSADGRLAPPADVANVRAFDSSDSPTAALALALAPCVVLSRDHSLVMTGLRTRDWPDVIDGLVAILGSDAYSQLALLATEGLLRLATSAVGRSVERSGATITFGALGAGLAIAHYTGGLRAARQRLGPAAGAAFDHFAGVLLAGGRAAMLIEELCVDRVSAPDERIARHVALSPGGLTIDDIAEELEVDECAVTEVVWKWRAFELVDGRWSFGRPATGPADFLSHVSVRWRCEPKMRRVPQPILG